jgi:membrane-associated phospholipid phosphatase
MITDWKSVAVAAPNYLPQGGLSAATAEANLTKALQAMANLMTARGERQFEILQQSGDMVTIWRQFLHAHDRRRPATATLIQLCVNIGGYIVMHWKRKFKAPRPAQVYPGLIPVIPTPNHPAYPSGHSCQSYLVPYLLNLILTAGSEGAEEMFKTDDNGNPNGRKEKCHGIFFPAMAFAQRIAVNREVAGVHFASDSTAGRKLASDLALFWKDKVIAAIAADGDSKESEFASLVRDVRREWNATPQLTKSTSQVKNISRFKTIAEVVTDAVKRKKPGA